MKPSLKNPDCTTKPPSEPTTGPTHNEYIESGPSCGEALQLPTFVAGSGSLDRLVETARDYAQQAASENTLKAYAKDWAHFARWCRMKGIEPILPSPEMIGLYLADLATPSKLDFVHFPALRREAQRLCHSDDTVWRDFIAFSVLRGV